MDGRAGRWRWWALAVLLAAEAMNLLDATVVTVAAPVIRAELGGPAAEIPWFNAAYTLPFAVLLVTGGRLGDLAGRRRVFVLGTAGFAAASLVCALAPAPGLLLAARAVQGAAAALIIPQTVGLIRAVFDGPELARAMSGIGPVMGLAAILGPLLGAVLTRADLGGLSWRAVFLVNLPLAGGVLAGARLLPGGGSAGGGADGGSVGGADGSAGEGAGEGARGGRRGRLDPVGTVLLAAAGALLSLPLLTGGRVLGDGWRITELAFGAVLLVLFAVQQRVRVRAGRAALVEPGLFRDRAFPSALVASTLFFAVLNGLLPVIVLQVQLGAGLGVLAAGLTLLPWTAAMAAGSLAAGARLVPRHGHRVMRAGLAVLALGLAAVIAGYAATDAHRYPWPVLPGLAVAGLGCGLFTVPFFTTALAGVRPHETGSAAGLLNAVQQFGATLGTALLGGVFLARLDGVPDPAAGSLPAARLVFAVAVGLVAAVVPAARAMVGAMAGTGDGRGVDRSAERGVRAGR
ncbi:MFS transporter [Kitasatospora sp. NPDC057198]|uniref:MFS transporter n=1 Tax=Kitasatospora sp. NPDC057198 TaxID=3346046 RepID=UPI003635CE43